MLLAMWPAVRRPFLVPLVITLVTAVAVIIVGGVASSLSLAIVFAGVLLTIAVERQPTSHAQLVSST